MMLWKAILFLQKNYDIQVKADNLTEIQIKIDCMIESLTQHI